MNEARSYRRLLGMLLAWALVPLPFVGVIMPPFWLVALGAAIMLVLDKPRVLTRAQLNMAGVVIMVVVLLSGGLAVGPLRPLGHLLLLLATVRSVSVKDRASFFSCAPLVLLVWVVSITASTHLTLAVYFGLSAVLLWWVGIRLQLLSLPGVRPEHLALWPRRCLVVPASLAALASLLLVLPVFLLLPRLQTPWLAVGGGGRAVAGFSSIVDLASVSGITESRETALIIRRADGAPIDESLTRLRATAFDLLRTGMWLPRRTELRRPMRSQGVVWLDENQESLDAATQLQIVLAKPTRYLFLPAGTVALGTTSPVAVDPAGGVMVATRRLAQTTYSAWVRPGIQLQQQPPTKKDIFLPRNDARVGRLAYQIAGGQPNAAAMAQAISEYLQTTYTYSRAGSAHFETDPVSWFLLEGRKGHCEYFAGSMVILLRHLGVPARMVGGYLGGTPSLTGKELVVSENNAHTWVEVWLGPTRGWTVYDPTPADEASGSGDLDLLAQLRLVGIWVESFWYRWIMTFDATEQVQLLEQLSTAAAALMTRLRHVHLATVVVATLGILGLLAGSLRLRRQRRQQRAAPAAELLRRVARRLQAQHIAVPAGATLRRIGALARSRWPSTASALDELVMRAELELYARQEQHSASHRDIHSLWSQVKRGFHQPPPPQDARCRMQDAGPTHPTSHEL